MNRRAFAFLCAAAALFFAQAWLCLSAAARLPAAIEIVPPEPIALEDFKTHDFAFISATADRAITSLSGVAIEARVAEGNFAYQNVLGRPMLHGSYPVGDALALSSGAAMALFMGEDVLGEHVEIDGRTYTVSGVYREKAHSAYASMEPDTHVSAAFYFAGADALPNSALERLQAATVNPLKGASVISHPQHASLLVATLFVTLAALWMAAFVRVLCQIAHERRGAIPGLIALAALFVPISRGLCAYLPSAFLPEENIFEISFYAEVIKSAPKSLERALYLGAATLAAFIPSLTFLQKQK